MPKADANILNPIFDHVVSNTTFLPTIAASLNIGEILILGRTERFFAVDSNMRKLADHVEAIFGALWLDAYPDYQTVSQIILPLFTQKSQQAAALPSHHL